MKVLITGATSGIGLALTKLYAENGNEVIAIGRKLHVLNDLKQRYPIQVISLDLRNQSKTITTLRKYKQLDIVILNAGTCEYMDDLSIFDSSLFTRVISTNVISVGYCLEALLPNIKKRGHLALMGSSAAFVPFSRAQAYGSSKAAIAYLANSLRMDIPKEKLNISLVTPGFVKTPLTDKNNFPMPGIISAEQAAVAISNGISKNHKQIRFPSMFTFFLKVMGRLPNQLWFMLASRIKK